MSHKNNNRINRRTFLALTGGTGAGLVFQSQEKYIHKLIPYVNAPKYPKPGEWAYYLTTCRECPAGCGLMMWHRDGRVTKAEGNPENPVNKGKLCIRGQSSVLGEYDPDRLKIPKMKDEKGNWFETNWDAALGEIKKQFSVVNKVLTISNLQTGSLAGVMEDFAAGFNQKPLYYEAFNYETLRRANAEMYGRPVIPKYDIQDSDLIISFGADFLETWLSPVEFARAFEEFHSVRKNKIGKLIYFGPVQSLTATNADEFVLTEPGTEAQIIGELMKRLGRINAGTSQNYGQLSLETQKKLDEIAEEIKKAKKPVILAGNPADKSYSGMQTVLAANRLNEMIGNEYTDFTQHHALSKTAFKEETQKFFESVDENTILIVHDTNPVYSLPESTQYFEKAGKVIYIGPQHNETAALSDWILPSNYYLEDWGDYEPWQGTVSLLQPVMQPIYDTRSAGDIFMALMEKNTGQNFRELVQDNWTKWSNQTISSSENGDEQSAETVSTGNDTFKKLLQNGYLQKEKKSWSSSFSLTSLTDEKPAPPNNNSFFLNISPSHRFYDGKLANRGWLQEIPHPVSNIVWQSWVDMNSEKACELEIEEGDIIQINTDNASLNVTVRLSNEIGKNTLSIEAGQGHASGEIASGVGVNVFSLLPAHSDGKLPMVKIEKTSDSDELLYLNATTDQHDRELLRHEEFEKIKTNSAEQEKIHWPLPKGYKKETDLYKGPSYEKHRWAMAIDLQKCIGCKACEAACYAENNLAVVGKENCRQGYEMSWLKVVPYKISEKSTAFLPVPCQHCDSAPCEPVCPVYASVHNEEGLNAQIYNRCIGTRYCSNNCPYKVRRFNWKNIPHDFPMNLQLNPEVTVRERGVMEKCTFCIQRIRNKEYQAKEENRELKDGEIVPACAQTCPTNAIVFGDLMDENSEVKKLFEDKRRYQLLHELNTKTAVVYLKKITV